MVKNLNFIVFIFCGMMATAQIPKNEVSQDISVFPKETVHLSVTSNILLAGELLQYKAYSLNASNKKSDLSKLLYVSLRNANDSVVFNHKLKVENGSASGDFFIPSNLNTGIYKLIAYTNFSKNNINDAFAEKNIYVVNTFVKSKDAKDMVNTVELKPAKESVFNALNKNVATNTIKIQLDKDTYGLREKVTLSLQNMDIKIEGNYSLSVRKVNPIEISGQIAQASTAYSSEQFYLPELRGEIISGVVLSKLDGTPAANREVALTIPGEDYIFKIAKTNAAGRFFISVDEPYNAENSIIQLYAEEKERNNYKLLINNKELALKVGPSNNLKLQPELKNWLQERSVQLQVENAYFDFKKDSVIKAKSSAPFYDSLGTVFLLDDYTRFPTVKETFTEVVTLAAIRGTGTSTRFLVNNTYDPNRIAKFNNLDPLVLMDGMLIQDNTELVNYNAREIESIRVIVQPYRLGSKIFSGIIAVETKSGNFKPSLAVGSIEEMSIMPALSQKQYFFPDYKANNLKRIPDYRMQLLWQPTINLAEDGFETTFYTSDVTGIFEIFVDGFTIEGEYIKSQYYFEVNKN